MLVIRHEESSQDSAESEKHLDRRANYLLLLMLKNGNLGTCYSVNCLGRFQEMRNGLNANSTAYRPIVYTAKFHEVLEMAKKQGTDAFHFRIAITLSAFAAIQVSAKMPTWRIKPMIAFRLITIRPQA